MTDQTSEDNQPFIDEELGDHKTDLQSWIEDVSKMQVTESRKKVVERFQRDCKTLLQDLDCDSVSAADLSDFNDRRNSLEVQYHAIREAQN